jgi:excisionase family DNA binding protein
LGRALKDSEDRRTYTIAEAARLMGVSAFTMKKACEMGQVPALRLGGRVRRGAVTGGRWVIPRTPFEAMLGGENNREVIG